MQALLSTIRKTFSRADMGGLFVGSAVLFCLPLILPVNDYVLQVLTHALLLAILAMAWNVLGLCGAISLGHAAFFGVGSYTSALLSMNLGFTVWLSIPLAGITAAAVGLLMGLVCTRLRGAYFALATLAFVEIPKVITDNWDSLTRGSLGLVGLPKFPSLQLPFWQLQYGSAAGSYYLVLLYGFFIGSVVLCLFRSNFGLALEAIREEEIAAAAVGISVKRFRLLALLGSAAITGIGGGCYAHLIRYIEPDLVYSLRFSTVPMIFALCGGRFTALGPALAALLIYPLDQFVFHPLLPAGHEFVYGLVLIITILFMPEGLWSKLRRTT
ncbi:MAG: branched-chain amino acid ABC transporter permease [Deltaproteobacteria bacterium]|nr:branched-chain amino acid ABC transporter permease [Deltaproteobacteria bacterium]